MQLISRVLGVVLALAFLSGCFGMPDPTRLTELPSLDPTVYETVLVYPMYDMRQDKELSLKLEGHFDYSKLTLGKYYMVTNFSALVRDAAKVGITPNATFDDFDEGTDKLRYLNHFNEKYVLAIFLLDFSKSGLALSVEMQGFLVNTRTGAVEWSDSGADISELSAEFDFAYLEGKVKLSNSASESFENALVEMLQSFPNIPPP